MKKKLQKGSIIVACLLTIGGISQIVEKTMNKAEIKNYVETNFKENDFDKTDFDFKDEKETTIFEWLGF